MGPDEVRDIFVAYVLSYKGSESPSICVLCEGHLEVRIAVIVDHLPTGTGLLSTFGPLPSRQVRKALLVQVVQRFVVVPLYPTLSLPFAEFTNHPPIQSRPQASCIPLVGPPDPAFQISDLLADFLPSSTGTFFEKQC